MPKKVLTPDSFIAELNRRLREDKDFEEGMSFIPHPPGSSGSGMTGYATTGPVTRLGIYARVAHAVSEEFDVRVG